MVTRLFLFLFCFLFATASTAQPIEQWAAIYNGSASGADFARSFKVDGTGNTYIVGASDESGTGMDCTLVKYNPEGEQLWAAHFNGTDNLADWAYAVAVDPSGNAYITGETTSTASGKDFITIKYDPSGNELWNKVYNGTANGADIAVDIALGPFGNVYVTGKSAGTGSSDDYLTIKYDSSGNEKWVERYNGTANSIDDARTITTDGFGFVYVSGGSIGDSSDFDFLTIKYDSLGNTAWQARYNGPGNGYDLVFYQGALATDSLQNVYIAGYSTGLDSLYEYTVVKYDSAGTQLWDARHAGDRQGKDDFANTLLVDGLLNVYTTGALYDSVSNYDLATLKYDPEGTLLWAAVYDGADSDWDEGYALAVDGSGNVLVGGRSNKAGFSGADFVLLKYDNNGNEQWNIKYARGGFSWLFNIALQENGDMFVGGWTSEDSPANADFTIVKYNFQPVAVADLNASPFFDIQVYPNPTSAYSELKINSPRKIKDIYIYQITGKLFGHIENVNRDSIVLKNMDLPKGIYFFHFILMSGNEVVRKVIVE